MKKLNKVEIESDKTQTKQKTYSSRKKIWDQSTILLGENLSLKAINFKVLKTNREKLKLSDIIIITNNSIGGH